MEGRLDIEWFSIRYFLRISFLAFLSLILASSSWAQQVDSYPSEKSDLSTLYQRDPIEQRAHLIFGQKNPSDKDELVPWALNTSSEKDEVSAPEQKALIEQFKLLTFVQKNPSDTEELPTPEPKLPSEQGELLTLGQKIPLEKEQFFTRGQKAFLLNAGSVAAIFIYGLARWDYAKASFAFKNEGWFDRDSTKYGGADKFGHFWSNYAMSHLYAYVYRKWGYTDKEANLYGALSSLAANTFMEIFDGFSPSQGFSYEDMIMNIVGCGIGYVWGRYPSLANKIDFRIEYLPEFSTRDFGFSTNYERQKFLIALKADGFNFIKNRYLKYLEFHVGYYARGYKDYEPGGPDDRRRYLFVGIGFNVSRLVQKYVNTTVFNYIQVPYTSVNYDFKLD